MRSLKLVATAAVAIVALSACGGAAATPAGVRGTGAPASVAAASGAPTTPASAAPASSPASTGTSVTLPSDLCKLLTPAELKTVTGKTYEAGVPDTYGQCSWNVGKSSANSGNLIIVGGQAVELTTIKSSFPGGVDTTVDGHAGYWNGGQGLGTMWVDLGGGKVFTLGFPRSSELGPDDQAIAQKLAELAVAKI